MERTTTKIRSNYILPTRDSFQVQRHKKAGMAILKPNKINFKTETVTKDKEQHIIIKWQVRQQDIIIINI